MRDDNTPNEFSEDGATLEEVAKVLNLSVGRIRQIENQALLKLKKPGLKHKWQKVLDTLSMLNTQKTY